MRASKRILAFEGARAIAVFVVLIFHLNHLLDPYLNGFTLRTVFRGEWANMFFFTLSGYLAAVSCSKQDQLPSVKTFCRKRIKKIYPLWLATVIFSGGLSFAEMYLCDQLAADSLTLLASKLVLDVLLLRSWFPGNPYIYDLNGPGWFLSAMVLLWLLTIPLLKWISRMKEKQQIFLFILLMLFQLIWDALRLNHQFMHRFTTGIWLLYPISAYIAGMIFGRNHIESSYSPFEDSPRFGILLLPGILVGYYVTLKLTFLEQAYMICFMVYFIRILHVGCAPLCSILSGKKLVAVGGVSMELLLLHVPVMRFVQFFGVIHNSAVEFVVVVVLTGISALIWKYLFGTLSARCRR